MKTISLDKFFDLVGAMGTEGPLKIDYITVRKDIPRDLLMLNDRFGVVTPVRYHEVRCRADVRFPDGTREIRCSYHNPWYQRWFMEPIDDNRLVREKLREHTRKLGDVMVMYCDEDAGRKGPVSAKDI